jgi:hypothetical protein
MPTVTIDRAFEEFLGRRSAGGPTLQLLGAVARLRYEGLLGT